RHWFKTQNLDDSIAQGRLLLDRELQRLGVTTVNQEKVAQRLNFHKLEELLAALGRGEITPRRLGLAIQQEVPAKPAAIPRPVSSKPAVRRISSTGVLIEGVDNLMIKLAKCCKPEKPDAIIGYVTRDRGITIHRQDCAFMQRTPEDKRERILNAVWTGE
ncbi:MAG: GTP pyrophosphokinase, partial [Gallionella sp.]|nr:GTP pyrophosphokinase [Gallionella sp.]